MKKFFIVLLLVCCTAFSALAQTVVTLPIAANSVADLGNGPARVRMLAGNASIFTSQGSGTGSTSGSSTTLTLTATPVTPPIAGALISGTGITSGTTVVAYNGTTTITLSAAMTVAGGTAVSWGAACPSTVGTAAAIQASSQADYYVMYTQARMCAVSPGGPVNTLLVGPIFYDQTSTEETPGGSSGQIQYNNAGVFGGFTASGDCTIVPSSTLVICTETNGVPFVASATTDTTNAANISSGNLAAARIANALTTPGPIGGTTPAAGAFTTLSASSTVSGAGFTSLFASPPAIGGTTPAAGNFTTFSTASNNSAKFGGPAYFGFGTPWLDVKSGTNGCAAAVGNGIADDTAAIQCQITWANTNLGGAVIFFPCGTYHVTSGGGLPLSVGAGLILKGAQVACSTISAGNNDVEVVHFVANSSISGGGLRDIWIVGDQTNGSLTNNAVVVDSGLPLVFEHCKIWGGNFALQNAGIDGTYHDCYIMGDGTSGGGVISTGANWYERVKLDTGSQTVLYGFNQGANVATMENHFVNCDFSGSFTNSIKIADTNNLALTTITNSIMSVAVSITGGKYTMFVGDEFGGVVASSVNESVVGSYGISALTFTGTGTRSCAGNSQITC